MYAAAAIGIEYGVSTIYTRYSMPTVQRNGENKYLFKGPEKDESKYPMKDPVKGDDKDQVNKINKELENNKKPIEDILKTEHK